MVIKAEAGEGPIHRPSTRYVCGGGPPYCFMADPFKKGSTELVQNRFCHVGEVRDPELIWPESPRTDDRRDPRAGRNARGRCRDPRAPTRKQGVIQQPEDRAGGRRRAPAGERRSLPVGIISDGSAPPFAPGAGGPCPLTRCRVVRGEGVIRCAGRRGRPRGAADGLVPPAPAAPDTRRVGPRRRAVPARG